jgi:toxin ParE1/3/4
VSIRFHAAAEVEHLDHVAYYESRQKGLGSGYLAELEKVLETIVDGPRRYAISGSSLIRRAHLRRFPITVIFRESGRDLEILAVAHQRRRPTYWVSRL